MNDISSAQASQARLASMGQLAAAIGHEVQQPLAGIALNAEAALRWLDRSEPDPGQARAALTAIVEAAARANEAVRSLRRLVRQEGPGSETCALDAMLADVILPLRQRLARERIVLRSDFADGARAVGADRVQLRQLLHNLITNAVDALAGIDGRERTLHIASRAQADGSRVLISVSDAGAGLPCHGHESVFEPLVTYKADGMGMGLAICRAIVEAHGGVLRARRGDVHGCVVEFTMPAADDIGARHAHAPTPSTHNGVHNGTQQRHRRRPDPDQRLFSHGR